MKYSIIYIEENIANHHRTQKILSKFSDADIIFCKHYKEIFNPKSQNFRLQKKKPALILAEKKGKKILETPKSFGIGGSYNYYFSHLLNCIFDCRYCFLQGMFNSAHYVIFVNYEDFFLNIKDILNHKSRNICFFSGYDCDSLALEDITEFMDFFLNKFIKLKNGILEIRSKSTNIKSIKKINPSSNIIPAFSLNPEYSIKSHEHNTPKLINRLNAIRELQNLGWNIGIRFDPFIWYGDLCDMSLFFREIFSSVKKNW